MRVGRNPNLGKPAVQLAPIVLAVITHLPNEDGYHAERFKIIRDCVKSMVYGARMPHSLVVWDNGSSAVLRDWLSTIGADILIQSVNIGKVAARNAIANLLPPDTITCYSDDDMLFRDDWLAPQLELLDGFPNVACVSGYPLRMHFGWGCENTIRWASSNGLEVGNFIPDDWTLDFAEGISRTPKAVLDQLADAQDYRVTYGGLSAYCTAHHAQFVARAGTIAAVAKADGACLGDEREFDIALDDVGLRLSTIDRLVTHQGNKI